MIVATIIVNADNPHGVPEALEALARKLRIMGMSGTAIENGKKVSVVTDQAIAVMDQREEE